MKPKYHNIIIHSRKYNDIKQIIIASRIPSKIDFSTLPSKKN